MMKRLVVLLSLLASPLLAQINTGSMTVAGAGNVPVSNLGVNLCVETEQTAATTGTIEEVLASCTIPADTFPTRSAGIAVFATWDAAANANAKTMRIRVDGLTGTVIAEHSGDTTSGNQLQNRAELLVDGSGTLAGMGTFTRTTGAVGVEAAVVTGLTFSGAIDIAFTGLTATASGDVTLTSYRVELIAEDSATPGLGWPALAPDGLVGAPSYSFTSDPTTGTWHDVDGGSNVELNFSVAADRLFNLEQNAGGTTQRFAFLDSSAVNVFICTGTPGTQKECQMGLEGVGGSGFRYVASTSDVQVDLGGTSGNRPARLTFWDSDARIRFDPEITGTQYVEIAPQASYTGTATITVPEITGTMVIETTGGLVTLTGTTFAALGTPANGTVSYCSDCTKATPCAGAGAGALAKRLNGAWDCD